MMRKMNKFVLFGDELVVAVTLPLDAGGVEPEVCYYS